MENYYKITAAQATSIGKFNYSSFEAIDPFVGEQKDGSFLVSETIYNLLKDRPEFKKFDWSAKTPVPKEELDPKVVAIP